MSHTPDSEELENVKSWAQSLGFDTSDYTWWNKDIEAHMPYHLAVFLYRREYQHDNQLRTKLLEALPKPASSAVIQQAVQDGKKQRAASLTASAATIHKCELAISAVLGEAHE